MGTNKVLVTVIILGLIFIFKQELKRVINNINFKSKYENIIKPKLDNFNIQQDMIKQETVNPETKQHVYLVREGFYITIDRNFVKFEKWNDNYNDGIININGIKDRFESNIQGCIGNNIYSFVVYYDNQRRGNFLKLTKLDTVN